MGSGAGFVIGSTPAEVKQTVLLDTVLTEVIGEMMMDRYRTSVTIRSDSIKILLFAPGPEPTSDGMKK